MIAMTTGLTAAGLVALAGSASAQPATYDFSAVTQLAQGALVGQGVSQPVPGFELLLVKDGRVVYRAAFGTWALDQVAAADSATKTLSGAVIMSLVDSSPRPFSLDTRLSEYIPAFTGDKAAITIRQAFAHASGLPGNSTVLANTSITLQQAALAIAAGPYPFGPAGMQFAYGGVSMNAAGAVAELAGERSFVELFQQRVTGPLDMRATRFVLASTTNPRIAGGCESTGLDFAKFMEALRRAHGGQATILSPAAARAMFTRQTAPDITVVNSPIQISDPADYGVGVWLTSRDGQGRVLSAVAAGARGFSSWIDFDDGVVGVFATDLSVSGNVQPLLVALGQAAQAAVRQPICPANCDGSTQSPALTALDFSCFLGRYRAGLTRPQAEQIAAYANCDGSTVEPVLNALDFACFLGRFQAGCPEVLRS